MNLKEVLARLAEAIDNVDEYSEEFDFLHGIENVNPTDSEEYKNLEKDYKELKEKYKKRFIESLTKSDDSEDKDESEDEAEETINIEDLDLSGEND